MLRSLIGGSVAPLDRQGVEIDPVETAGIDGDGRRTVRRGTGGIGLDAAHRTEAMGNPSGVEAILGDAGLADRHPEIAFRQIGEKVANPAAAGAVAGLRVALSLLGGVTGILLGLGLAWLGTSLMGVPFVTSPAIIVVAFVFSAVIGMVFGYFPARRAAQLNPIEALRHE